MPKRVEVRKTDATGVPKGKVRAYAVLYHVNEGFDQVLAELQQLDTCGVRRQVSKNLHVIVEETRAEVNFELVELLQERELKDWTRFGRLRERAEKHSDRTNADRERNRLTTRANQPRGSK
jgi:hypothetical protein